MAKNARILALRAAAHMLKQGFDPEYHYLGRGCFYTALEAVNPDDSYYYNAVFMQVIYILGVKNLQADTLRSIGFVDKEATEDAAAVLEIAADLAS